MLFAGGSPENSDIPISALRSLSYKLVGQSVNVKLVFEKDLLDNLSEEDSYSLASLCDHDKVKVYQAPELPKKGGGNIIAVVHKKDIKTAWATNSKDILSPNETWGHSENAIINGFIDNTFDGYDSVSAGEMRPVIENKSDREIVVHHDLDGNLKAFGDQFWQLVEEEHRQSAQLFGAKDIKVVSVKYRDRYLFNPLSVALTLELLKGLRSIFGMNRWQANEVSIITSSKRYDNSRPGNKIYSDWVDCEDRDYVLKKAFKMSNFEVDLLIPDRRSIQHSRALQVEFSNSSELTVRLDQGVGYWRVSRSRRSSSIRKDEFEFSYANSGQAGLDQEAKQVIEANPKIKGSQTPTELFVKVR